MVEHGILTYEPTVNDKILRILYRLDHGEELIHGRLKEDDGKFCVLGLFADESGIGEWLALPSGYAYKADGLVKASLTGILMDYYNLRSETGVFDRIRLPEHIASPLHTIDQLTQYRNLLSLSLVNDGLIDAGVKPNEILADIIRSGIIFRD